MGSESVNKGKQFALLEGSQPVTDMANKVPYADAT